MTGWPDSALVWATSQSRFPQHRSPHDHSARAAPKGATTADALQTAALSVRREKATSHPFYWAPFVVLGGG
ncbi:MAG: CHAT domain-containing protein [Chthoniobacterales bacterium]|nr:CHAT domain-containing protein [Chthoniobacterales bacterium]